MSGDADATDGADPIAEVEDTGAAGAGRDAGEPDDAEAAGADRPRHGRRDSLLWGVVGALSFLVLIQGYELLAGDPVGPGAKFGVAAVVGLVAAAATRALGRRVRAENESS